MVCAISGQMKTTAIAFCVLDISERVNAEGGVSGISWGFVNVKISAVDAFFLFFLPPLIFFIFCFLERSPTIITLLHLVYSLSLPTSPLLTRPPPNPILPPLLPSSTLPPTLKCLGAACAALRSNGSVCCHFSDAQCEIKRAVYVKSRGRNQTAGFTSGDASDFNHFKLIYMFLLFTSLSAALSQFSSQSLGIFKKSDFFFFRPYVVLILVLPNNPTFLHPPVMLISGATALGGGAHSCCCFFFYAAQ